MSLIPRSPGESSRLGGLRWQRVSNGSGVEIPPHSLLVVTGTTAGEEDDDLNGLPVVDQPDADSLPNLWVSGPLPIRAGRTGMATFGQPAIVAYDDADTPAVGDTWGSAAGSWLLTSGKSGWVVMSDPTAATTVAAARAGGTGLTTGNTSSAAQDSTTTVLRFSDPTGVKVTKGATASDPDIVSLTFGQSITFVECVEATLTKTRDGYGALTDVNLTHKVRTRTVTVSDGATIGATNCATNPTCWCPVEWAATCCPTAILLPDPCYLNLVNKTGDCTCIAVNSVEINPTPLSPGETVSLSTAGCASGTGIPSVGVSWSCVSSGIYAIDVTFSVPFGGAWAESSGAVWEFSPASGDWSSPVVRAARREFACDDPGLIGEETMSVGTWTLKISGVAVGSFDLVLSI